MWADKSFLDRGMKKSSYANLSLRPAFTLVELVVAISIIVLLIALLLPATASARHAALRVQCMGNIRQLCVGLTEYSQANRDTFPPNQNLLDPPRYWCDMDRLGRIIPTTIDLGAGLAGGSVYHCPEDDGDGRSYSMNVWSSSSVDSYITALPPHGSLWHTSNVRGSRLILVTESWSWWTLSTGSWFAPPAIGYMGLTPAQKFGVLGGIAPPFNAGRWGYQNCELTFLRHHLGSSGTGAIVIGFADGHAQVFSREQLINARTGHLTGAALWSPNDVP
jgi:prepilin-type N-terminal cleavage/methylation domain-containing protein